MAALLGFSIFTVQVSLLFVGALFWQISWVNSFALDQSRQTGAKSTDGKRFNFDFGTIPPIYDDTPSSVLPDEFHFPSAEDWNAWEHQFPRGTRGGYRIIRQYKIPREFGTDHFGGSKNDNNMTLHTALTLLDPIRYPSLSSSRKACRNGSVLVQQICDDIHNLPDSDESRSRKWNRGRVGDIVRPGDRVGIQNFVGDYKKKACYPSIKYSRPNFVLPVVYEDDHMAIIDKPAGISIYGERTSRSGAMSRRTVRAALPFVLTPPKQGTVGVLQRPATVHRLDTPTSGLLVVAKTKGAMMNLSEQFRERRVQKTYAAIVNGIPKEENVKMVRGWNVIDYPLGQKTAITHWRSLRKAKSLNAKDGMLTLAEIRLKTGRYHQIRRHMAWICRKPLVGDALHAGKLQAHHFRKRGLYLCSRGISLKHPFYNSNLGRKEWESINWEEQNQRKELQILDDGTVEVTILLDLPRKFEKLLDGEEKWAARKAGNELTRMKRENRSS